MKRTGLEIMKSPDTTAGEIADIIGKACPPVGIVHCDKTNCRDCWLAWLLTGEAVRGKAFVDAVKETIPALSSQAHAARSASWTTWEPFTAILTTEDKWASSPEKTPSA